MPQNRIDQGVKDRIHQLKQEGWIFQDIYKSLKSEGVAISESYARKVFNKENPCDKSTLTIKEPEEEEHKTQSPPQYHFNDDDEFIPPPQQP